MTYGGAAAALFDPFVGVLVYVCFAIVKPDVLWAWSVPQGNYSRVVALALLGGWALKGFGDWRLGKARGVLVALLGFLGWAILGATQAARPGVSWTFVEAEAKIVLPVLVGMTTIDSVRKIRQLAWVILVSQGYLALEFNLSYLAGYNRVQEEGFAGLDNNSVAIALVACVGLALFMGLSSKTWWQKATAFVLGLLMIHAVLLTFSRGGMVALIATGFVTFLLIPKTTKHYVAFLLVLLLTVRMAGPQVVQRFNTSFAEAGERDESASSRLELWADCWDCMLKKPIFGVGPDHWPLVAHTYGWPAGKEAHTLWLQIGAENGFPGLLFLMSFYGLCVARLWPLTRETAAVSEPWLRDAARMATASVCGFAVAAQFVSLEGLEVPYYITLVGASVLKLSSAEWAGAHPIMRIDNR
jgi:probable O-glycosylation ligase (exosortase A-associated)